jgi:HD-like signal output (HDOD) protein
MSTTEKINYDRIIAKLDELPTLPTVVHELNRIISDPMSSTGDIEKVMEKDQSLTAKVLKLANSAYYAIPGGVKTLARAVAYLGYDTVNQLVLAASIFENLKVKGPPLAFDINKFWQHSIGVGMASEVIAKQVKYKNPSDMFTCGLIHDIGKVALLVVEIETLMAITTAANEKNLSFDEAEDLLGMPKHTVIGQMLVIKWNLPVQIQSCVRYHHQRETNMRGGISVEMTQQVDIVMMANLMIHALKFGNSGYNKVVGAPKVLFERLNIGAADLPKVTKDIQLALQSADNFLKLIAE